MASAWVERHRVSDGLRYKVRYRLGGKESQRKHAGTFKTKREAVARMRWTQGELAAMRVPDLGRLTAPTPTIAQLAEQWQAARVDVTAGTAQTYRVALRRVLPRLGGLVAADLKPTHVAGLVAELTDTGLRKQTIRKTVGVLAMIFDHHGMQPNPARDRRIKLPREDRREVTPPTAEHILAVHALLPPTYRLPLLVLDATGMRVGELEGLTWDDIDEARGCWRVSRSVSKTGRARWVPVPPALFAAVLDLPRNRPEGRVFGEVTANRLRTAIGRACAAAEVPAFSPHGLRHRRISLEHLRGEPWARIGELVGQRNVAVTANTYTHVMSDEVELDYAALVSAET